MKNEENKYNIKALEYRKKFPIFDKPDAEILSYLDNAATCQKPSSVIESLKTFYHNEYSTVHRGVYTLSQNATIKFNNVRKAIKEYINATDEKEVIFTSGTTDSINLVAESYVNEFLKEKDEIMITEMEHHSNIVPWQQACKRKKLTLKVAPIDENGDLIMSEFEKMLNHNTKLIAITHVSNVLGTINPIKEIIKKAHSFGARVLIDGAQAIGHQRVDMQELNCDFYCFSGHKMYGPTGVGVLYGKKELLDKMPPYRTGGSMVQSVDFSETTFAETPTKFEAGTPPIAEVIGLGKAIEFLESLNFEEVKSIEDKLQRILTDALLKRNDIRIIGTSTNKSAIVSFVIKHCHPHDAGTILNESGVAVRVGHHCAQPLMKKYKVPATIRASFSFYNIEEEIKNLMLGIDKVKDILT